MREGQLQCRTQNHPSRPNRFPFMPGPCLARNQAQNGYFVKRLIAFISTVYGGQFFPIEARRPSSIRPNAHAMMIGANRAPKPGSPEENFLSNMLQELLVGFAYS